MNQSNSTVSEIFSGLNWSAYIRLVLNLSGVFLNLLNIIVFLSPQLKGPCYQLMLVKSAANFFYQSLSVIAEFTTYCVNCQITQYYSSVLYTIVVSFSLSSCIAMFRMFIEIALSIYTFSILRNKVWTKMKWTILIGVVLAVVACGVYAPRLFAYTPFQIPGSNTLYRLSLTPFGLSVTFRIIGYIQQFLRIFFAVVVVSAINIVNIVKFNRRFRNISSDSSTNMSIINSG